MKLFFRSIVFTFLLAICQQAGAQGTIDISYKNKTVTGNTWTFDVYASGEADYIGPDQNNWQAMNIRMDIALPAGVTIVSGSGVGSPTYTTGTVGVQTSVPGTPPPGSQEMGLTISRTGQTDLSTTPVLLATFTIVFSGPPLMSDLVTPRTNLGTSGSSWTNLSTVPATGTKRAFSQPTTLVLPVTFTSFTGVASGCAASLAWATGYEQNSKSYGIEFGTDGKTFATVGSVASKNSALGGSYTFSYDNLGSATGFFRIKAVDIDGTFAYTSTVSVTGNGGCSVGMLIKVSPNPTANVVNIQGLVGGSHISVIDAGGKKLSEVVATGTNQAIYLSTYASGVYTLKIQKADGSITNVKVVKQ